MASDGNIIQDMDASQQFNSPSSNAKAGSKSGLVSSTVYGLTPSSNHSTAVHSKLHSKRRRSTFLTAWAYECVLVIFALGLLAAIVSILASFQHQPQPSWGLGINLNTVIALLATFLRNSILMVIEQGQWFFEWSCIGQ